MVNCDHRAILPEAHHHIESGQPERNLSGNVPDRFPRLRDPFRGAIPCSSNQPRTKNRPQDHRWIQEDCPTPDVQNSRRFRNLHIGPTPKSLRRMKLPTNLTKTSSCELISVVLEAHHLNTQTQEGEIKP